MTAQHLTSDHTVGCPTCGCPEYDRQRQEIEALALTVNQLSAKLARAREVKRFDLEWVRTSASPGTGGRQSRDWVRWADLLAALDAEEGDDD